MKKVLTPALVLVTALSLTAAARADVIAGPAAALYYGTRLLPWVLVGAVRSEERRVGKECRL